MVVAERKLLLRESARLKGSSTDVSGGAEKHRERNGAQKTRFCSLLSKYGRHRHFYPCPRGFSAHRLPALGLAFRQDSSERATFG